MLKPVLCDDCASSMIIAALRLAVAHPDSRILEITPLDTPESGCIHTNYVSLAKAVQDIRAEELMQGMQELGIRYLWAFTTTEQPLSLIEWSDKPDADAGDSGTEFVERD